DVEMPEMDGLEVLRQLKRVGSSVGAIMVSAVTTEGARATVEALQLGAFDFVVKPHGLDARANAEALFDELSRKITAFARTRGVRGMMSRSRALNATSISSAKTAADLPPPSVALGRLVRKTSAPGDDVTRRMSQIGPTGKTRIKLVVLGISTGGPAALCEMLPQLPGDLAAPVLIVQHMPPIFTRSLADDLNRKCQLIVEEATDGQPAQPGHVLIAPGGKHMRVETADSAAIVRITDDPPESGCRPSVDYLFRSAAELFGSEALGVIMTGMGKDGTAGCRLLKERGATIIAQDETTCVVYGMPREPIETGLADIVAPLDRIAAEIINHAGREGVQCV
ncbi:MAG: chemotaxis-specific protein-glutamate methyltransferase CheB, partial [Planctomycetes bacterium]|nr:chemotaxis-specific protein-glutamate methyltransferase CheB [Planctomycetota bacterium]